MSLSNKEKAIDALERVLGSVNQIASGKVKRILVAQGMLVMAKKELELALKLIRDMEEKEDAKSSPGRDNGMAGW
jgi:hypothetical protein